MTDLLWPSHCCSIPEKEQKELKKILEETEGILANKEAKTTLMIMEKGPLLIIDIVADFV